MHKHQRIVQLTSTLQAIRQLTDDDCIEVEKGKNQHFKSTQISSQRKKSHLFQNGNINSDIKPSVKDIFDLNRREGTVNGRDGEDINEENLVIPLLEVRNSKKRNVCNRCGRCFISSYRLKRHEVTHTGIRSFACQKCPRAFTRSDHLKRHLMRLHGGNVQRKVSGSKKPLKESSSVSLSKKQLNGSSSVSDSEKELNENRVFKCDICDFKTLHRRNVWRHKKNIHKKSI